MFETAYEMCLLIFSRPRHFILITAIDSSLQNLCTRETSRSNRTPIPSDSPFQAKTQRGKVAYHNLYRVTSVSRVFYVFSYFDINHQFNWVVKSKPADSPLCQLCLTEATCSTEACDFGLLFTFNAATGRERGAMIRKLR